MRITITPIAVMFAVVASLFVVSEDLSAADKTPAKPPAASESSVPDFMQEFTEPADEASNIPAAWGDADNLPDLSEPEPSEPEDTRPKPDPEPVQCG